MCVDKFFPALPTKTTLLHVTLIFVQRLAAPTAWLTGAEPQVECPVEAGVWVKALVY